MDCDHPVHLPGVLPDPAFRYHELRLGGSLLLDPCDPGLQPWYAHGAGYFAHRDLWPHYAAAGRSKDH